MVALARQTPRLRPDLGAREGRALRGALAHGDATRPTSRWAPARSSSSTPQRVTTTNDHGTGCSLSAAICAGLALGRDVPDAARDAKSFVLAALTSAADWKLGRGSRSDRPPGMGRMSDEPRAPLTTTTSIWPAAGVLIFAVVVLGRLHGHQPHLGPGRVDHAPTTVPVVVGGLQIAPSAAVLDYCTSASEIPTNINDVFLVPEGTTESQRGQHPQRRRR